MSILTGFKKIKKYIKTSSGYILRSLWTSASTVEMANGKTVETSISELNNALVYTKPIATGLETSDFPAIIAYVDNLLEVGQSISTQVTYASNSAFIIGRKISDARARYLWMPRTNNSVYVFMKDSDGAFVQEIISLSSHNHDDKYLSLSGGTLTGALSTQAITPSSSNSYDLGASDNVYANVYGQNIYACRGGKNYGILKSQTAGTTDTNGECRLTLGNSIASGNAGNAFGRILLYGTNTGYTRIVQNNNTTTNIDIKLPSSAGTLALTSHTHDDKQNTMIVKTKAASMKTTIEVGNSYDFTEIDVTESGYTPIGIVGCYFSTDAVGIISFQLKSNKTTAQVYSKGLYASSSITLKVGIDVLYVKN